MQVEKTFRQLKIINSVLDSLEELGYETPTPIQEQCIPVLLEQKDLIAQAQTGTGKTASFALPILSKINLSVTKPQAIIIAPTRELAIQVSEAFMRYAKFMKGFHVLPIYGGQDYQQQLRALKRGVHVIVGTPGRLLDLLNRKKIPTDSITKIVLDEADEMLNMGFIADIEKLLGYFPNKNQTSLFSATMPEAIRKLSKKYLSDATHITIKHEKTTNNTIAQHYILVTREQKLEALTRLLETEETHGVIIFVRTKNNTEELVEKLQARGYAASALNGDMKQEVRKKVINHLKNEKIDILVATDLAARGLDVSRVNHVINYDIPHDIETYTHRIGRTGRAGRKGKAIIFLSPREKRFLRDILKAFNDNIAELKLPSIVEIKDIRKQQLINKISDIVHGKHDLSTSKELVALLENNASLSPEDIAAAVIYLLQQGNNRPLKEISNVRFVDSDNSNRRNKNQRRRFSSSKTTPKTKSPKKRMKKSKKIKKSKNSKRD